MDSEQSPPTTMDPPMEVETSSPRTLKRLALRTMIEKFKEIIAHSISPETTTLKIIEEVFSNVMFRVFVTGGRPLTIDRANSNEDLIFTALGPFVMNLKLHSLSGGESAKVLKQFPNVEDLTIESLQLTGNETKLSVPLKLRKLTLINNKSTYTNLLTLFDGQFGSLTTLVLVSNTKIKLPQLPSLESITIDNQHIYGGPEDDYSSIKNLTMRLGPNQENINFELLERMLPLKNLKLLDPISWGLQGKIEALNVGTVTVSYFHMPSEENQILRMLDESVFYYLQTFLPVQDCVSLHLTHSHFKHLKFTRRDVDYQVPPGTLEHRPIKENREFYERLGPLVSNLSLKYIPREEIAHVLPYFTSLASLDFYCRDEEYVNISHIPSGLQRLHLEGDFCENGSDWSELFRRLNPTLTDLYIWGEPTPKFIGLDELTNLKQADCSVSWNMDQFLLSNRDTLERLELSLDDEVPVVGMWASISQMHHLKYLEIQHNDSAIARIDPGALPLLEQLGLDTINPAGVREMLRSLDGHKIISMRLCVELTAESETFLPELRRFPKLKQLDLLELDSRDLLPLIRSVHSLNALNTERGEEWDDEIIHDLRTYLTESHREIMLDWGPLKGYTAKEMQQLQQMQQQEMQQQELQQGENPQ